MGKKKKEILNPLVNFDPEFVETVDRVGLEKMNSFYEKVERMFEDHQNGGLKPAPLNFKPMYLFDEKKYTTFETNEAEKKDKTYKKKPPKTEEEIEREKRQKEELIELEKTKKNNKSTNSTKKGEKKATIKTESKPKKKISYAVKEIIIPKPEIEDLTSEEELKNLELEEVDTSNENLDNYIRENKCYILTNEKYYVGHDENGETTDVEDVNKSYKFKTFELANKFRNKLPFEYGNYSIRPLRETVRFKENEEEKVKVGEVDKIDTNNVTILPQRRQFTWEERQLIYDKYKGKCGICGEPLKFDEMTVDHIVPLAIGGDNSMENLQCCCINCNRFKDTMTMDRLKEKVTHMAKNLGIL